MLQSEARASSGAAIFVVSMGQWLIAFFSLTLFTDVCCTGKGSSTTSYRFISKRSSFPLALIAYRIWSIHRNTRRHLKDAPTITPAISIIVESGAVYSLCVAALLAMYVTGSYYHKLLLDGVTQLIVRILERPYCGIVQLI